MILKSAVNYYLVRPLRDLSEAKSWSLSKLERKLAKLDPKPVFYTEPRIHQKVCFYLCCLLPYTLQLLEMGLGKSKLVLDVFRWYQSAGKLHRMLILVPNVVNIESWRNEIAKHAPDLSATYIEGNRPEREEALRDNSDLCVSTYAGLNSLLCRRVKTKGKGKMHLDDKLVDEMQKLFDCLIIDESTSIMDPQSLSFRAIRRISKDWKLRIGLTGTPVGRDPMVLWSQFYAVDRGEALGETLGIFRQAFFASTPGYWGGTDYSFKHRRTKDLQRMMAHSSIQYAADECIDLPAKVSIQKTIRMSDEQWEYYRAVLDSAIASNIEGLDVENVFVRMRQITSGFVSIDGEPSQLVNNPKLDTLMQLVEELPSNEKLVVFNEYVFSGELICAGLAERDIQYARLYSGTKDKKGELRRFLDKPSCRVFVVNSQSGALGLNLQASCRYIYFYESPVSYVIRQQAEARCHRQGQIRKVFVYDLTCKNTVDERILLFLSEGKNIVEALRRRGLSTLSRKRL